METNVLKIFLISFSLLMITPVVAATDWNMVLKSYVPKKFTLPADELKGLELEPAKEVVKKSWIKYYVSLGEDFNKATKTDYSPFSNKWVIGGIDYELTKFTSLDQLLSPAFESQINTIAQNHYSDFISSEYVVSGHKVFDHKEEIFLLKKEIIFLKQNLELLKKLDNKEEVLPVEEPNQTKQNLILGVVMIIISLLTSLLMDRFKLIRKQKV